MKLVQLILVCCTWECVWSAPCDVTRWTGCKGKKTSKHNSNTSNLLYNKLKGIGMIDAQVRDYLMEKSFKNQNNNPLPSENIPDSISTENENKILSLFNEIVSSRLSGELKTRSDEIDDLDLMAKRQINRQTENTKQQHGDDPLEKKTRLDDVGFADKVAYKDTQQKKTTVKNQENNESANISYNEVEQLLKSLQNTLLTKKGALDQERKSLDEERQSHEDAKSISSTPLSNLQRLRNDLEQLQKLITRQSKNIY